MPENDSSKQVGVNKADYAKEPGTVVVKGSNDQGSGKRANTEAGDGWEFVQPDGTSEVAKQTNPKRSSERPRQTAEVPLGTGDQAEPPGGGGRASQRQGTPAVDEGRSSAHEGRPSAANEGE
jgi:hypothetical protein